MTRKTLFFLFISHSSWVGLTTSIEIVFLVFRSWLDKIYISCPTAHHVEKFQNLIRLYYSTYEFACVHFRRLIIFEARACKLFSFYLHQAVWSLPNDNYRMTGILLNPFLSYWSALTVKKHPRIQSIVHFSKLHNYQYIINHFMTDRCGYLKQYPFTL